MKTALLFNLLLPFVLLIANPIALAQSEHGTDKPHTGMTNQSANAQPGHNRSNQPPILCPVTGKPIDKSVFTRFRGKRVYFADKSCIEKFRADPGKYKQGLKVQWERLRPLRAQITCPVTGKTIDKRFFVELPDRDLYFATEDAKHAWEKDSRPYEKNLDACFTFQTHCGTCSGDINPNAVIELDGRKIYFCCMGCAGGFKDNPQAFLEKLDADVAANKQAWQKLHPPSPDKAKRDGD